MSLAFLTKTIEILGAPLATKDDEYFFKDYLALILRIAEAILVNFLDAVFSL